MTDTLLQSVFKRFQEELSTLRTSRATPLLVEKIMVDAYQTRMPLNQLATIQAPDATSIVIKPFDKSVMKAIEEAIRGSELGLNPTNEGEILRLSLPPLTAERRAELIKVVGQKAEATRVQIRGHRDELIRDIRTKEKDGELSEDQRFAEEKKVQKDIDAAIEQVNTAADEKEQELQQV